MYATYIPHVTESIYQTLYKEHEEINSLHQTKFENIQTNKYFPESSKTMEYILDIVEQIRKLKSNNQLSLKTEIDNLEIYSLNNEVLKTIRNNEQLIMGVTKSHEIELKNELLENSSLDKIGDRIKAAIKINS
jgi:valyl-tRNA synthetase